jgi:conjugative relaxase-like TrwC/TraI family protein
VASKAAHRGRVLCVAKVRPGGHCYYLEVVDTGVEAPGEWLSAGANLLELRDTVVADDLEAVLAGADPSSGKQLGRSHDRVKVAGFDLTFCAPKSVSLPHALGEPDVAMEVRSGHSEAVKEALSYVERRALAVRRGSGSDRALLPVAGVAAGGFVHRVSRALDPHLHTHVVVANLGCAPDGTWSAIDGRGVYAHAAAAGALYHAQLRHELTQRLGVGWEPPANGRADIAGIGSEVRQAFSQRATAIRAHLAERGIVSEPWVASGLDRGGLTGRTQAGRGDLVGISWLGAGRQGPSWRAKTVAAFATRAERDPNLAPETLRGRWEERAREAGLSARLLEATLDRVPRNIGRADQRGVDQRGVDKRSVDQRGIDSESPSVKGLQQAVEGVLGEFGSSVTRRTAVRAWCYVLEKGVPVKEVERAADRYLSTLEPVEGWAGARDGPGVGERRYMVFERAIEREQLVERRNMGRLLAARGMSRADDRNLGRGREAGLDLGH